MHKKNKKKKDEFSLSATYKVLLAGLVLNLIILLVVIALPYPSSTTFFAIRVMLASSAALILAIIPGSLKVNLNNWLIASGAMSAFVIVLLINPPAL